MTLAKTRSRMTTVTTFSRQNDAASRASTTYYSENLVLVVVLVLESKGLLIIQLRSIKVITSGTSEVQLRASSPVESLLAGYSEVRKPPTLILSVKWL